LNISAIFASAKRHVTVSAPAFPYRPEIADRRRERRAASRIGRFSQPASSAGSIDKISRPVHSSAESYRKIESENPDKAAS
jgi:hypothetical protein